MSEKLKKSNKNPRTINPFVLIFTVIVLSGLFTFIITPGTLTDGVYQALPKNELNFNNVFNIFRAIPYGLKDSSNIMILILVVGGALEIYKETGAIDNGITVMLNRFGKDSQIFLLILLIVAFSAIGGFLGWIEVLIPFIPIVISVILTLGYDSITAVAVCIVGVMGGFIAGPTNLYTVGVSNEVLQNTGILPQGSDIFVGLGFRVAVWVAITVVSVLYIVNYATKTKKDPTRSLVQDIDSSDLSIQLEDQNIKMTTRQVLILLTILGAMVLTVVGMKYGINGVLWTIDDISAVFFLSGILAGIIGKLNASHISDSFIKGAQSAIGGALIVGVARGVYWILETGGINATIIYQATELLKGTSPIVASMGIVVIVSLINGLIPSGSGKGALLSPIIVPIGMSLGLTTQTSVLAFQFGDGITNMFWFTYGTLLIFLNYGKVPLNRWYKFITPLLVIYYVLAAAALLIAIQIGF